MMAPNDLRKADTGQRRGPPAGFASGLSHSASKCLAADRDGLGRPEPNTDRAVVGQALEGLPGSQSGARAAAAARNQGDPAGSRRTNYEGQAGNCPMPTPAPRMPIELLLATTSAFANN